MHTRKYLIAGLVLGASALAQALPPSADEYGLSTYGLGSSAFSAGVTPPPGTYLTFVSGFYQAKIGGQLDCGKGPSAEVAS